MTVTDRERPRTKPARRLAAPPSAPRAVSPLYVPAVPERRSKLRSFLIGLAALGVLGGLALTPWERLPRSGPELRQALLDVGVPRQYREIMTGSAPAQDLAPAPLENLEDPALTSLLGKAPPRPPEAMRAPPAPATMPATAPKPEPKVYVALTTPAQPAPLAAAAEPAAASSYRVQIAATASEAEAEAAWREVRSAFPADTEGRTLSVRIAEVNGRIMRRAIVTGFPTASAAKDFCAKLAAADRGCILRGRG